MDRRLPMIVIIPFSKGQEIVDSMRKTNEKESDIAQRLKDKGFSDATIVKLMEKS